MPFLLTELPQDQGFVLNVTIGFSPTSESTGSNYTGGEAGLNNTSKYSHLLCERVLTGSNLHLSVMALGGIGFILLFPLCGKQLLLADRFHQHVLMVYYLTYDKPHP